MNGTSSSFTSVPGAIGESVKVQMLRTRRVASFVVLGVLMLSCAAEEPDAAPAPPSSTLAPTQTPSAQPSSPPPTQTAPPQSPVPQQGANESEILRLLWADSTPEEQEGWCELISLMGAAQFATFVVSYFPGELSPETVNEWSAVHCSGRNGLQGKDLFLDNVWTGLSEQDRRNGCRVLISEGPLVAGALVIQGLGQGLTYEYRAPDGSFSLVFTVEDFASLLLERC